MPLETSPQLKVPANKYLKLNSVSLHQPSKSTTMPGIMNGTRGSLIQVQEESHIQKSAVERNEDPSRRHNRQLSEQKTHKL